MTSCKIYGVQIYGIRDGSGPPARQEPIRQGLGKTWIGVVLMASVASLPGLITGLGSVTYAGVPDIAVGDVLGSCAFDLLILFSMRP